VPLHLQPDLRGLDMESLAPIIDTTPSEGIIILMLLTDTAEILLKSLYVTG
jgi:hypothetical protein